MSWCYITLLIWSACLWWSTCCALKVPLIFFHSEFVFLHVSHSFEVKHFSSQHGHQRQRATGRWERHRACFNVVSLLPSVGFFCLSASTCWPSSLCWVVPPWCCQAWLPGSAHLHLVWLISWVYIEMRVAPPVVSLEISELSVVVFLKIPPFGRLTSKSSALWGPDCRKVPGLQQRAFVCYDGVPCHSWVMWTECTALFLPPLHHM